MTPTGRLFALGGCALAALVLCGQTVAQDRQVYRYIDADGWVVYSDRAPGSGARDVQTKRVTGNTISTSQAPLGVQQAAERFPVTLYTFACGETCDNAQALLNRRGVPFSTIAVDEGDGMQRLQQLTGDQAVPVLQVGDKLIQKGFNEQRWNSMLDQAGYPKAPVSRTGAQARPLGDNSVAEVQAQAPQRAQ